MTYLKPCHMCPQSQPCAIRKERLALLRPAKVSSANFKCQQRLVGYEPGQRVEFSLTEEAASQYGMGFHDVVIVYRGIIMRPIGRMLMIWVTHFREESGAFVEGITRRGRNPIALNPSRMTPIEGRVKVCPDCGQPDDFEPTGMSDKYYCSTCQG
jgi:hypothetical protein